MVEYLDVIEPADRPAGHGGDPADASTWSSRRCPASASPVRPASTGWDRYRIAAAWVELMRRLGYERYGAAGNDAGSMISPEIGRIDPEHVVGVHVTQLFSFPSGDPAEFDGPDRRRSWPQLRTLQWFFENKMSFNKLHGPAAADAGLRAGRLAGRPARLERPAAGREPRRGLRARQRGALLADRTAASAARLYYENAHAAEQPTEPTTVPTGLAVFGGDFSDPPVRRARPREHRALDGVNGGRGSWGRGRPLRRARGPRPAGRRPPAFFAPLR